MKTKENKKGKELLSYILMAIGALILGYAVECFLMPNAMLDSGVTGISMIISKVTNIPVSLLTIIINIPLVYIGYKSIGKNFLKKSIYVMIIYSLSLYYFSHFESVTNNILLVAVYGGLLLGIGSGIIVRNGGCTDGIGSLSTVLSKKYMISSSKITLFINIIIFLIAGAMFGVERALLSLLIYYINYRVIDFVVTGLDQGKAALIITDNDEEITKEIYKRLGRTTTKIKGEGLISGDKSVLYCVLTRLEIPELKKIAEEIDDKAFITITDVSEIIGNNVKSKSKMKKILKGVK